MATNSIIIPSIANTHTKQLACSMRQARVSHAVHQPKNATNESNEKKIKKKRNNIYYEMARLSMGGAVFRVSLPRNGCYDGGGGQL